MDYRVEVCEAGFTVYCGFNPSIDHHVSPCDVSPRGDTPDPRPHPPE